MSTETSSQWWDEEDHDDVTGDVWRTKRVHVVHGRAALFVTARTTDLGHQYVEVDVPALPALTLSDARLLRVALDRAIHLVERIEKDVSMTV